MSLQKEVVVGLKRDKLQMGELERMVMDVLWDQRGWLAPGEIHEVLPAKRPGDRTMSRDTCARCLETSQG